MGRAELTLCEVTESMGMNRVKGKNRSHKRVCDDEDAWDVSLANQTGPFITLNEREAMFLLVACSYILWT